MYWSAWSMHRLRDLKLTVNSKGASELKEGMLLEHYCSWPCDPRISLSTGLTSAWIRLVQPLVLTLWQLSFCSTHHSLSEFSLLTIKRQTLLSPWSCLSPKGGWSFMVRLQCISPNCTLIARVVSLGASITQRVNILSGFLATRQRALLEVKGEDYLQ